MPSRILWFTLLAVLTACSMRDQSGCPQGPLDRYARDQALRGEAASLPARCELGKDQQALFDAGRGAGLKRYCTSAHGYALGVDGKSVDRALCDEATGKELQRGFEVGDNLRKHLKSRDDLLTQARDAERVAATLAEGVPARAAVEQQAATLRLEARSHENEVEALRGIVAIEKWR